MSASGPSPARAESKQQQSDVRALLQALPSPTARLQRQRDNLESFIAANAAAFDALPYVPWTTAPASPAPAAELRPSSLSSAHIGAYPTLPLSGGDLAAYYPGLLMSRALVDSFDKQYHCPTALDVPVLDYPDPSTGKLIKMVLVGDPTQAGPNLMDGGERSNCRIICASQPANHKRTLPSGKIEVSSSLVQLRVQADTELRPADELLFPYQTNKKGQQTFWTVQPEEYCAVCFSREHMDTNNLLHQCEGADGSCPVSRHRLCMVPVLSQAEMDAASFFCPTHLFSARVAASASTSAFSSVASQPSEDSDRMDSPMVATVDDERYASSPDVDLFFGRAQRSGQSGTPHSQQALAGRPDAAVASIRPFRPSRFSASPPRAHLPRAAAAAAAASSSSAQLCPPKHNLPVTGRAVPQGVVPQVYGPRNADRCLERNCALLGTERIPSTLGKQAGRGLAIKRDTACGAAVGYMWGHCITRDTWSILRAGGPEAIALCGGDPELLQHVEWAKSGVWWSLEVQALSDAVDEYLLLVSPQCPMGWINDPRDKSRANVELREPRTCVQSADGLLDYWLFPIHSTRALIRDEELFLDYGWSEAEWKKSKQAASNRLLRSTPPVSNPPSAAIMSLDCDSHGNTSDSSSTSSSGFSSSDAADDSADDVERGAMGGRRLRAAPPSESISVGSEDRSSAAVSVRDTKGVRKLAGWSVASALYSEVSGPLRSMILAAVQQHGGTWFGPQLLAKATNHATIASSQVSTNGKDSWCKLKHIGADFAEYKCCCGAVERVADLFPRLTPAQRLEHTSVSVLNMVKARLAIRAAAGSRDSFSTWVQLQLDGAVQMRVAWQGGTVCCSCFRALIGVSRSTTYSWRNKLTKDQQATLQLNPSGNVRRPKQGEQLEVAVSAVRSFVHRYGQSIPNPRNKNLDEETMVVPAATQAQLLEQVLTFYHASNPQLGDRFARSTLWRALKAIRTRDGIVVSARKSKLICRCDDCELLDCAIAAIGKNKQLTDGEKKQRLELHAKKQRHLLEVAEQRKFFDTRKAEAIAHPRQSWCIAFDGMDQAKTQLPSRMRFSKQLEGLPRLGVHAVGAFVFGGPVPVLGLLNYPDLRKDSSLSVTTLLQILDRQWIALEKQASSERDQPASDSGAGSTSAGDSEDEKKNKPPKDPDVMDEGEDEDHPSDARRARANRRAARKVTSAMLQHAASQWPERLHLTFDNAVGEAKNQFMFRFLGLLVLFNIFHTVTVSTLLVGHTHDIVDQMFSVWARILRVNDATTYEAMRALFRDKYHSKIKGLVALMRGGKRGEPEVEEAVAALGPETVGDILEARDMGDDDIVIDQVVADEFEKFAAELKLDRGVKPVITLQTFNVNVKAWMARAKAMGDEAYADARENDKPAEPFLEEPLKHVAVPHVFGIEKDEAGDVWLYNKYLANSDKITGDGSIHHYPNQKTGSYSTRIKLHAAGNAQWFNFDPDIWPSRHVDSKALADTFKQAALQEAISKDEHARLTRVLTMFARREAKHSQCVTCQQLLKNVNAIGTVSRKQTGTAAEKADATEKSTKRNKAQTALEKHLNLGHPALGKKTAGWWTKWTNERAPKIQASYVDRGIVLASELREIPYHTHPRYLCEGANEAPVFESHDRVDLGCLAVNGPPEVGQVIIVRAGSAIEPFWIGTITRLLLPGKLTLAPALSLADNFWGGEHERELELRYAEEAERRWKGKGRPFEIRMSHVVPTEIGQPTVLGGFYTRDVDNDEFLDFFSDCMMDRAAVLDKESSHVRRVSNLHHKILDGGAVARCFKRYIAHDEAGLAAMRALPASAFLPTREELGDRQYERFLQMSIGCMINSPKLSNHRANVTMTGQLQLGPTLAHTAVPTLLANRAGRNGEELLAWYHNEEERNIHRPDLAASASSLSVSSGAAAASSAAASSSAPTVASRRPRSDLEEGEAEYQPSFGRAHVSDRHVRIVSMEELPPVDVMWMDIDPLDYVRLRLHPIDPECTHFWELQRASHSSEAASASALKPGWLVDMFENTSYSHKNCSKPSARKKKVAPTRVEPEAFIYWGRKDKILTEKDNLTSKVWKLVKEDLTEQKQKPTTRKGRGASAKASGPRAPARAKPGGARARKPAALKVAAVAAASALEAVAAVQKRPTRQAAAAAAVKSRAVAEAEDESSNNDEDEEEEEEEQESEPSDCIPQSSSDEADDDEDKPLQQFAARKGKRARSSSSEAEEEESPAPVPPRRTTRAASKPRAKPESKKKGKR